MQGHDQRASMKYGKAAVPSVIVPEIIRAAEEPGVSMITDLVNQIIVEGVSVEWEFSAFVNCNGDKRDT